jgi:hypothetical protein
MAKFIESRVSFLDLNYPNVYTAACPSLERQST